MIKTWYIVCFTLLDETDSHEHIKYWKQVAKNIVLSKYNMQECKNEWYNMVWLFLQWIKFLEFSDPHYSRTKMHQEEQDIKQSYWWLL